MPLNAILLVLLAALLHATWNVVAKKSGGALIFSFCSCLITTLIWTPISYIWMQSYPDISILTWGVEHWLILTLSAAIHAVYYVVLLHGYNVAPLSIVYPIARGTGPLMSSMAAIFIFSEELTLNTVAGISTIVFGIILLTWQKANVDLNDRSLINGLKWGALTGISIAFYTLTDSYGVKVLQIDPVLFDYWGSLIRVLILLPFVFNKKSEIFKTLKLEFPSLLTIATLSPLAYILVLYAVKIAPVSHVAPARELSLMFGAFFGGKILKEGHLGRRMCAAALIAIGVILLAI